MCTSVVGSNPEHTCDNTLCDPQRVVQSLGVICVHLTYVLKSLATQDVYS